MDRNYNNGSHSSKDGDIVFVGTEVEHTPAYGMKTLFVTGVQNSAHIIQIAKEKNCAHVYLGANMSFDVTENTHEQWEPWEIMAKDLLKSGLWVTLDIDIKQEDLKMENRELFDILACPVCKKSLLLQEDLLICSNCDRAYKIKDGIAVMISDGQENKK